MASDSRRRKFLDTMASSFRALCHDESLADIDIMVEDRVFPCHRIVLATFSPYFKAMFQSGMIETRARTLDIPNVSAKSFECFRCFVYSGECKVNRDNALDLLEAAALFQVESLQQKCEHVLATDVDKDNCLTLFRIARSYNCQILFDRCRPFVLEGFHGLWKTEEFFQLDWEDVLSIVRDDNLIPIDEEQIYEAAMGWLNHDLPKRQMYLSRLLGQIRFVSLSPEYLIDMLYNDPLLYEDKDCRLYLDAARNYHLLPARRHEFSSLMFNPRNSDHYENVLLVLTEYDMERTSSFNQDGKCLWAYSFQQDKWYTLSNISFKQNPGVYFSCVSFRNNVYVIGGDTFSKQVLRYDSERNEWALMEGSMRRGRCCHMLAAVRESVYVMGGRNNKSVVQKSIEEYSIPCRRFRTLGELCVPVMQSCVVVIGEKIYVIGGQVEDGSYSNMVQVLDTRNREVQGICELPETMTQPFKSVCFNNRHFILTTDGIVFEFQANKDITFTHMKQFPRECLPVLAISHYCGFMILLSGNKDKPYVMSKMFRVDIEQSPIRIEEIESDNNAPRPKTILSCMHGTVNKDFVYHTYFQ